MTISQAILDVFKFLSLRILGERDKGALEKIATEVFFKNNVIAYFVVEILSRKSHVHNVFDISLKIILLLHSHLDIVYSNYAFGVLDREVSEYQKDQDDSEGEKLRRYNQAIRANKFIFTLLAISIGVFGILLSLFWSLESTGLILLVSPIVFSILDNFKKLILAHWRLAVFDLPPATKEAQMLQLPIGFFFHQSFDILLLVNTSTQPHLWN